MTAYGELVGFARALRAEGVTASTPAVMDFCRACTLLEPAELYWTGRVTLVAKREDIPIFDRVFASYFGENNDRQEPWTAKRSVERRALDEDQEASGEASDEHEALASRVEILRTKDFADMTEAELAEAVARMKALRLEPPERTGRRWRSARHGAVDMRGTTRHAMRSASDGAELRRRRRKLKPRRLILILDVSRSMADYSRALLMFARGSAQSASQVEVFCFGTRLNRLTSWMSSAGAREVLPPMSELAPDWDGGTRIGESLKTFLDSYGHLGLARGAVVVVCSDGLEQGDPEVLREQMARLARLSHRTIWANPLKGTAGYEPTARGMAVALPFADDFAGCRNLADLERLGALVSGASSVADSTRVPASRGSAVPRV